MIQTGRRRLLKSANRPKVVLVVAGHEEMRRTRLSTVDCKIVPMPSVTAFAPATVSNVACGFDVLGFALGSPGDEVTARLIDGPPLVRIDDVTGDEGRLPRDATKNTGGIAAWALLTAVGERRGVALSIRKGLPLSSGLGGSAASAVAAVVAVDGLLGSHASRELLLTCALEGEQVG